MIAIGLVLFLVFLWRKGNLGDLLGAITGAPQDAGGGEFRGIPYKLPRHTPTAPGRAPAGGIGGAINRAEEERRRRERPTDPILPDTPLPGSKGPAGTWRPKWSLAPYPNDDILRRLAGMRN